MEEITPKPKAPVFPLPFLACATTFNLGSFIINGNVVDCTLDGLIKSISNKPFFISGFIPNSSHVFTDVNKRYLITVSDLIKHLPHAFVDLISFFESYDEYLKGTDTSRYLFFHWLWL